MSDLETRLVAILRDAPSLMTVMRIARDLGLPDWLIVSGAVYQRVWNHVTGRDPDYGVRDYDLAYFDPDTSYEAEDVHIKRAATAFPPPFDALVGVDLQAIIAVIQVRRVLFDLQPGPVAVHGIGDRHQPRDVQAAAFNGLDDVGFHRRRHELLQRSQPTEGGQQVAVLDVRLNL